MIKYNCKNEGNGILYINDFVRTGDIMRKSIDTKRNILLAFIFLLFIIIFFCFFSNYDISRNVDFSKYIENDDFVIGISCNNINAAFDKNSSTYYFSKKLFSVNKLKINSSYKTKYVIDKISDDEYTIYIYSKKYFQKRTVRIIDNSIISINLFNSISNYDKQVDFNNMRSHDVQSVIFQLMDNDYVSNFSRSGSLISLARFEVRGSSSTLFSKKSFKIEFDEKKSLLGMKKDDDWILDALYMDKSKVRNKLSSDVWNEINSNQIVDNSLNGEFVEVFLNNEYDGLFVLKNKVSKKMLNVSDNGLLAKSFTHINNDIISDFLYENIPSINKKCDFIFGNLEIKYCTSNSLKKFVDKIRSYYGDNSFYTISSNFDVQNYLDYYVLISFISGVDNVSKNLYYSLSDADSKIIITPWDLDLTWGLDWSDQTELHSVFLMDSSSDVDWLNSKIINNFDEETLFLLRQRYWELRNNIITMDTINRYLDSYEEALVSSGAVYRDSERWYDYDIEYEIELIREWASRRIQFLDEYFS